MSRGVIPTAEHSAWFALVFFPRGSAMNAVEQSTTIHNTSSDHCSTITRNRDGPQKRAGSAIFRFPSKLLSSR